jgi:hypothetical protein
MPKFKSVLAGLAISTAMSGGVIGLGALTTASSANATASAATDAGVVAGWGGGCHRRCGGWGGWGGGGWGGWGRRHHRGGHVKVHIHLHNSNTNNVRGDSDADAHARNFNFDREDERERALAERAVQ